MEHINKILDIVDDYKLEMKDMDYKNVMDSLGSLATANVPKHSHRRLFIAHVPRDITNSEVRFNNVNYGNNRFIITEDYLRDPIQLIISIIPGNYTIDELCSSLTSYLNGSTRKNNRYHLEKYDDTGKIFIKVTHGIGAIKIEAHDNSGHFHNTLNPLLGFTGNEVLFQGSIMVLNNSFNILAGPLVYRRG